MAFRHLLICSDGRDWGAVCGDAPVHADNCICDVAAALLAPALERMKQLTSLDLGCNQLKAAGVASLAPALASMTQMTSLDLESTRSPRSLTREQRCSCLQHTMHVLA